MTMTAHQIARNNELLYLRDMKIRLAPTGGASPKLVQILIDAANAEYTRALARLLAE
jgi:hypothetical protein